MINIIEKYNAELDNARQIEGRIIDKFNTDVATIVKELERALAITKTTDAKTILKGIWMLQDNIKHMPTSKDTGLPWEN
jgi:molecular chaperone GrpE (heat shock protein)